LASVFGTICSCGSSSRSSSFHVYLAFYHDYIEGRGTVSSIIGGWKSSGRSVTSSGEKTLVLGLGNILMGDEGVGVL